MSTQYHYRSDLRQRPLPEILYTIFQHRVAGTIQVVRGEVVKRVCVRDGAVIHASSSDLQESLGCYLLSTGHISRQDFRRLMRERRDSDQRFGTLLVEGGILVPSELQRVIRRQTAQILWNLFSWSSGDVTFSIGDFDEPSSILVQIPMRQAIKEGTRWMSDVGALLERVGTTDAVPEPIFHTEDLIDAALRREEYELLKLVDGDRTLDQLCSEGPYERPANGRLLYAFYVLEFLRSKTEEISSAIRIRLRTTASSGNE